MPSTPQIFQAAQVADLVGIREARLAKFVESPGYGIVPSLRQSPGKGIPRLYTINDLMAIALAWWLFQAGFRSQVIGRVLKNKSLRSTLLQSQDWETQDAANRFLIVRRNIVGAEGLHHEVIVATRAETIAAVQSDYEHALQVLPVGTLLKAIWDKLRKEREE